MQTAHDFPVPPSAPSHVKAAEVKENAVTLNWDEVTSEKGAPVEAYIIEARECGKEEFHEIAKVDSSVLTHTATKLKDDTEYDFAVKAENSAGVSTGAAQLETPVKTVYVTGG